MKESPSGYSKTRKILRFAIHLCILNVITLRIGRQLYFSGQPHAKHRIFIRCRNKKSCPKAAFFNIINGQTRYSISQVFPLLSRSSTFLYGETSFSCSTEFQTASSSVSLFTARITPRAAGNSGGAMLASII